MEIQKFAKLTKAAKKTLEDLLNSYVEKELTIEACMEQSQAKATDIIAKAKCIEQAAILRSKEVLEKAECDSTAARAQMDKDKEDWENEKKSIARTHHFENNDIKLDIGGLCFSTSLTTLTRFPDTMIGAMFSGRHYLKKNDAGAFFIDRDGTHFRHILNFLRSPENYMLTLESNLKEELEGEAEFYGLKDRMFPARFYPAQHMQYPPHGWGGNQHIRSMVSFIYSNMYMFVFMYLLSFIHMSQLFTYVYLYVSTISLINMHTYCIQTCTIHNFLSIIFLKTKNIILVLSLCQ
jgi:hypothetical protein